MGRRAQSKLEISLAKHKWVGLASGEQALKS